jgi:hypothetical protein
MYMSYSGTGYQGMQMYDLDDVSDLRSLMRF